MIFVKPRYPPAVIDSISSEGLQSFHKSIGEGHLDKRVVDFLKQKGNYELVVLSRLAEKFYYFNGILVK